MMQADLPIYEDRGATYAVSIALDDRLVDDLLRGIVPPEIGAALLEPELLGELLSHRATLQRTAGENQAHAVEKESRVPQKHSCPTCQGRGWTREMTKDKDNDYAGRARSQVAVGGIQVPNPARCGEVILEP